MLLRLVVMSLRTQSLLNLRLYKMRKHELRECQRSISDVLAKSCEENPEENGHISPTPSPAGSEGSNCSKVRSPLPLRLCRCTFAFK